MRYWGSVMVWYVWTAITTPIAAENIVAGPVRLEDPVAIDGDSLKGWAVLLPDQRQEVTIRIRGIDAPEMKGTCPAERAAAHAAKEALAALLFNRPIVLTEIAPDKYYGRLVAQLADATGRDIGALLLARGLVKPYDGKGARSDWC